jgi:phenol 2-monooxygenase
MSFLFQLTISRLYTQLDISATGPITQSRQGRSAKFQEEGGHVEASTITAEEVLEQANRIFAPYKLKFASTLSWFTVWKSKFLALSICAMD